MRLPLDRHVLIGALADTARLPPPGRDLIEDVANEVLFGAARIGETAIRHVSAA